MARRLFAAGKVEPPLPFGDTGCRVGFHLGPMLDAEKMNAAGGAWKAVATCGNCGGTVGRQEFGNVVAMDDALRAMGSE